MNKKQFLKRHRDPLGALLNIFTAAVIVCTVVVISKLVDDLKGLFE